jgi:ElaB/YqjD/DUF883 family membrane-anchored ribosome-binding protein
MNKSVDEGSRVQLMADFKTVVSDAESLLRETANLGGEELHAVRARAEESLRVVKARIATEQAAFIARTQELAGAADDYVHANPWAAIGFAAGAGLAVGLLSGRRK